METQTTLADTFFDHDFPLIKSQTLQQSFLMTNGFIRSNMEMVALQPLTYTSLKDLLPPPVIVSPPFDRGDSWREIPIKDPLLQHAAWAYLQPATTASKADDRSCAAKLKDGCLGLFGCFGGLFNDVISTVMKRWFWNWEDECVGDDSDN